MHHKYCIAIVITLITGSALGAQEQLPACVENNESEFTLADIRVNPQPIFDEDAPDAIALHRWANAIHVVTKPFVILERLPFDVGDLISNDDVIEAEAILRAQRYIANAKVIETVNCEDKTVDVDVTTFDNWSLLPTLSFGRSGGENSTILGVQEDNLLGWGVRTRFRYSSDEQRSGYSLGISSAVPGWRHANAALQLEDNDDGEQFALTIDKPFYQLGATSSQFIRVISDSRVEDIFQNGITRNSLAVESLRADFNYGFTIKNNELSAHRILFGITKEEFNFALALNSPSMDVSLIPQDRDFLYPWLGYQYVSRNIVVKEDVYLINQPEDINLGLIFNSRLGIEASDTSGDSLLGIHANLSATYGFEFGNILVMQELSAQVVTNTSIDDFLRIDALVEAFYRVNAKLSLYGEVGTTFSKGQYLDQPIALDDKTGVRGYPNQYQHGAHRVYASAEARAYTDKTFYQLFNFGYAAFADIGRAFNGDTAELNEAQDMIASIGIGLRLYSNKASTAGVVHIDLARPLTEGENINNWEWSATVRRTF